MTIGAAGQGIIAALPSLVGLATNIATAVPGLKKVKKTRTGQKAAARASGAAQRGAVAGSQTGFGATRGLNLRTGLRQAAEVGKQGGAVAADAAAQDEVRYNRQQIARNQRLADFGADAADMGANIGQSIVESQAARKAELEANAELVGGLEGVPEVPLRGVGPLGQDYGVDPYQQTIQEGEAGLQQLQDARNLYAPAGPSQEQGGPELRRAAEEETPLDMLAQQLGFPAKKRMYSIAPELELQHTLENLALQEGDRQGLQMDALYARIRRQQNLPAVRLLQKQLELEDQFEGEY